MKQASGGVSYSSLDCKDSTVGCSTLSKDTTISSYDITKPGTGSLPVISKWPADSYKGDDKRK